MTRAELEHAIRAACDLTAETEMIVFGSQAILGQYPEATEELRQSAAHDLAVSKLVAYRDKDRDFVRVLLQHELVKPWKLRQRIGRLPTAPTDVDRRKRLLGWLDRTLKELGAAGSEG